MGWIYVFVFCVVDITSQCIKICSSKSLYILRHSPTVSIFLMLIYLHLVFTYDRTYTDKITIRLKPYSTDPPM